VQDFRGKKKRGIEGVRTAKVRIHPPETGKKSKRDVASPQRKYSKKKKKTKGDLAKE